MRFIKAGMILAAYLFIIIIGYFAVSTPFENFMDDMAEADAGLASGEIDQHVGNYKTFFNMAFAIMGIAPIVWFLFYIFSRESGYNYY